MKAERLGGLANRPGKIVALVGVLLLCYVDFLGYTSPIAVLFGVLMAGWAMAVWLPTHRQGSRSLPVHATLLGAGSVLVSALGLLVGLAGEVETAATWGFAETFGLLLVLFVVARRGRALPAVAAGLMIAFALGVQPARAGPSLVAVAIGLAQGMLAVLVAGFGLYQRISDATREHQLLQARAEQRMEIARDLHDFVAHHVTGIVVQAQGARLIAERDPQRAVSALEQIEAAGGEAMSAMRRMVGVLRGQQADAPLAPPLGLTDLVPLTNAYAAAGGPPVHLCVDSDLSQLPMEVTTTGYRVVMEALTNVRQHATQATAITVTIRRTPQWLFVTVADDGLPPQRDARLPQRGGFGLAGLHERVSAVGGWFRAGPGIERGWAIDAALPLRREEVR